jgi:hypothetical protein
MYWYRLQIKWKMKKKSCRISKLSWREYRSKSVITTASLRADNEPEIKISPTCPWGCHRVRWDEAKHRKYRIGPRHPYPIRSANPVRTSHSSGCPLSAMRVLDSFFVDRISLSVRFFASQMALAVAPLWFHLFSIYFYTGMLGTWFADQICGMIITSICNVVSLCTFFTTICYCTYSCCLSSTQPGACIAVVMWCPTETRQQLSEKQPSDRK